MFDSAGVNFLVPEDVKNASAGGITLLYGKLTLSPVHFAFFHSGRLSVKERNYYTIRDN